MAIDLKEAVAGLEALGGPDEIAAYLVTHHCQGPRKMAAKCPVSKYLRDVTGSSWVSVGYTYVTQPGSESVQLPPKVKHFTEKFDRGHYDDLIDYVAERRAWGSLDVSNLGGVEL